MFNAHRSPDYKWRRRMWDKWQAEEEGLKIRSSKRIKPQLVTNASPIIKLQQSLSMAIISNPTTRNTMFDDSTPRSKIVFETATSRKSTLDVPSSSIRKSMIDASASSSSVIDASTSRKIVVDASSSRRIVFNADRATSSNKRFKPSTSRAIPFDTPISSNHVLDVSTYRVAGFRIPTTAKSNNFSTGKDSSCSTTPIPQKDARTKFEEYVGNPLNQEMPSSSDNSFQCPRPKFIRRKACLIHDYRAALLNKDRETAREIYEKIQRIDEHVNEWQGSSPYPTKSMLPMSPMNQLSSGPRTPISSILLQVHKQPLQTVPKLELPPPMKKRISLDQYRDRCRYSKNKN